MTKHRPRIGREHCDFLADLVYAAGVACEDDHARDIVEVIAERIADHLSQILGESFDEGRYWRRAAPMLARRRFPEQ